MASKKLNAEGFEELAKRAFFYLWRNVCNVYPIKQPETFTTLMQVQIETVFNFILARPLDNLGMEQTL